MVETRSGPVSPSSVQMHKMDKLKSLKPILLNLGGKLGAAEASVWVAHLSAAGRSQHYSMRTPNKSTELLSPAVIIHLFTRSITRSYISARHL